MIKITNIADFSLKDYLKDKLNKADRPFWCAGLALFISLNLIFMYHSAHYLFGDHDWQYLKNGVSLSAGLFEGRFSQFLLINLITQGSILPILNNLIGIAGYALGVALLARYWQLPHNKLTYTLFALFTGITPYILSFMYFAFLIMPVLSWNLFIIGALLLSERSSRFQLLNNALAITLFTLALGGYPPVINLVAVALTTRVLIHLLSPNKSLKQVLFSPIINFGIACVIYKLCLMWLNHTGAINSSYYNLQTTPISEWAEKFLIVLKDYVKQFSITLPFITTPYKLTALGLTFLALITILKQSITSSCHRPPSPNSRHCEPVRRGKPVNWFNIISCLCLLAIPLAGLSTLFLSTSLEETEFSPRIDFFGLKYVYSAMFALILLYADKLIKNIALILALFSILYSAHTLLEAQKVWKLGFDTEMQLYKRVLKRYEQSPIYTPNRKYIMVQAGSPSFRQKFYQTPYTRKSDDLLSISYTPGLNTGVMWNYDAQTEYADMTAYVYTFTPDSLAKETIKNAKAYPAKESVAVGNYWILNVFSNQALQELKTKYNIN